MLLSPKIGMVIAHEDLNGGGMQTFVTIRTHFSAAHRLYRPDWGDVKNSEVFGACANPHGHGHNYELEVTVEGAINPETGMIVDMKDLKALVNDLIVERVDHKHLNLDVPFLNGIIPTAENLAVAFWAILESRISAGRLHELRLQETERNIAVVRR
jgi:6-pyruvoyltetrahydropterin/6-carboxytetrahydropterin synthase